MTVKQIAVVSDYKDTNFWKQFTTALSLCIVLVCCFRLQRYKLLKAIHNKAVAVVVVNGLFQTTKIQTFESNSQLIGLASYTGESCFRLQRYKLLKAIHNPMLGCALAQRVVSDYKDTNFWKQFTTIRSTRRALCVLFQTTKIQTFESNSQPSRHCPVGWCRCFRLQRYKLLKAIHNVWTSGFITGMVVSDYKDTNFWKQFTTLSRFPYLWDLLFQTTKIQTFESNSQRAGVELLLDEVVSDYKDTNFWKQFTTHRPVGGGDDGLFQTTKIQTFESNSQLTGVVVQNLKVVSDYKDTNFWKQFTTGSRRSSTALSLFQTTKIQTFESNSQRAPGRRPRSSGCFRLQRYKLLKAIHNEPRLSAQSLSVVSDYKDTNFWKQFTTDGGRSGLGLEVVSDYKDTNFWKQFTTRGRWWAGRRGCFRLQRYKLLKAIHNHQRHTLPHQRVVSDYKDTNFWKQFTTRWWSSAGGRQLFQTTKIQTFESNSQRQGEGRPRAVSCFRLQRYKLLKAIHNGDRRASC